MKSKKELAAIDHITKRERSVHGEAYTSFIDGYDSRQEEVDKLVKCIKKIGEISSCPLAKMYSENFLHDNSYEK